MYEAIWACYVCRKRGGFKYRINNCIEVFLEKEHREASPDCKAQIHTILSIESLTEEHLIPIQELELVGVA